MILIIVMLIIYIVLFTLAWTWFFRKERPLCEKLYASGTKAFEEENYGKAKKYFAKIVFLNPNYEDARYQLGLTFMKLRNYPSAKESFEQALKITPNFFKALFNFAQVLQILKEYDKAEENYNKALKENEKSHECYFELGLINCEQKKYEKALELLKQAEELGSVNKQLPFYVNKCNHGLCDFDDEEQGKSIIENYLALEATNKGDLPVEFNKTVANAYAKLGNTEKALEYCQKSLINSTEDVECYKLLALIQYAKKNYVEAKNTLSTAIRLQPKDKELHNILSYSLCQDVDDCPLQKCREKYEAVMKSFLS